jgi:hypothetical protein
MQGGPAAGRRAPRRDHCGGRVRAEDPQWAAAEASSRARPAGRRSSEEADGQERVVRHHGAHADEYGIARGPQRVRDAAIGLAADPFGIARGRGDASVERLSKLEHDGGPVLSGPASTIQVAQLCRRSWMRGFGSSSASSTAGDHTRS